MLADHPIPLAALTGFISGLLICIPVGPVNLTIIHEGARRGFRWALLIGLGATMMEVVYCAIAFTGFASFFQKGLVKAAMELTSFVFLLFLGIKFVLAKNVAAPTHLSAAADKLEERIEGRLHPHSAFMIGSVRVIANPAVLLFWIILAANFISREWVEPTGASRFACVGGVAVGAGLWFTCLSYVVSLRHKQISEKTLLRLEHFSGIALLGLAFLHGANIIWQLARHRI